MWHSLLTALQNPALMIGYVGFWGILTILFLETGVFLCFFLPGDSLVLTAGLLASPYMHNTTHLSFQNLLIGAPIASIFGNALAYSSGFFATRFFLHRPDTWFFKRKYFSMANDFYIKYGGITILFARFIPIARTFAPIVAGVARMPLGLFLVYNIVGGTLWTVGLLYAGYFLGKSFGSTVLDYLHVFIFGIIALSVVPIVWGAYKKYRQAKTV